MEPAVIPADSQLQTDVDNWGVVVKLPASVVDDNGNPVGDPIDWTGSTFTIICEDLPEGMEFSIDDSMLDDSPAQLVISLLPEVVAAFNVNQVYWYLHETPVLNRTFLTQQITLTEVQG